MGCLNYILLKDKTWYQFINLNFIDSGTTTSWYNDKYETRFAVSRPNESLVGLCYFLPNTHIDDCQLLWLDFQSANHNLDQFERLENSLITQYSSKIKSIISYNDGRWLIFLENDNEGQYCITDNILRTEVSEQLISYLD
jgi:hypothetical protein